MAPGMAPGMTPEMMMMQAMGGCGGGQDPQQMMMMAMMQQMMMGGMGAMAGMPGMPGMPDAAGANPAMMAQMAADAQDMQQEVMERESQILMQQMGKGKSKGPPKKQLEIPPPLVANPEKMKLLDTFLDAFPFEDRHRERLMASMASRIDSFEEDVETLFMAMGGARNPAALLTGIVKTMEDGEFKPRDEESRAQFRRAKELKQEALAAQAVVVKGVGSVREKFLQQQKRHNKELETNRAADEERKGKKGGKGRGRSSSRDRGRRSRSRSRRRSRSRSRSRSGGDRDRRGGRDDKGFHKW